MRTLSEDQWLGLKRAHEDFVMPWMEGYRARRARRESHPVHDFLFGYYQTNRQTLTCWRPMADMLLLGDRAKELFLGDPRYCEEKGGVRLCIESMDAREIQRADWVSKLLEQALGRPARFSCFGLHEWAMVYKSDEIRHEKTPLRVSKEKIEEVVEGLSICCTHHDAFRFFTPEAIPLNSLQPRSDERHLNEQFGCVHFNMDLYRWSYKLSPWIGSALITDCFKLAIEARALDMRASPYDVSSFGYEAIMIETAEGREQYRREQREIYEKGQPLARRLLEECRRLTAIAV
ncbi:MAG: 3-methyladenine DNA glycosylase [Verrucomicrobiota bacterium]